MFPENRFMELLILGALALIIIGPKDLPIVMRRVGQFVGKMRAMANEFRASFDELARQSELEELRKEVEAMRVSHQTTIAQINPLNDTSGVIGDINQHLSTPLLSSSAPETPVFPAVETVEPAAVLKPRKPRAPRAKASPAPNPPAAKASPRAAKPKAKPAAPAAKARTPRKSAAVASDAS
jgi:sec-independent protein translocase protein TatB